MQYEALIEALRASTKALKSPQYKGAWEWRLEKYAQGFLVAAISVLPVAAFFGVSGSRVGPLTMVVISQVLSIISLLLMTVGVIATLYYTRQSEVAGLVATRERLERCARDLAERFPDADWPTIHLITSHWKERNVVWLTISSFVTATLLALYMASMGSASGACLADGQAGTMEYVWGWWSAKGWCRGYGYGLALVTGAFVGTVAFYTTLLRSLRILLMTRYLAERPAPAAAPWNWART